MRLKTPKLMLYILLALSLCQFQMMKLGIFSLGHFVGYVGAAIFCIVWCEVLLRLRKG